MKEDDDLMKHRLCFVAYRPGLEFLEARLSDIIAQPSHLRHSPVQISGVLQDGAPSHCQTPFYCAVI
jgi:hypothetical protein